MQQSWGYLKSDAQAVPLEAGCTVTIGRSTDSNLVLKVCLLPSLVAQASLCTHLNHLPRRSHTHPYWNAVAKRLQ